MSRMLKIKEDMDAITMADMKTTFDELAEAQEAVEIDMASVEFIVTNVGGQPLRLLTHLRMQGLIASTATSQAA